ncbi:MAG: hypothetical protein RJB66_1562 [Pseudomonadota bacterium]
MGMLSKIGDFLFGKAPEIFDNKGEVSHKLTKRTWDAWNNRIKMNPEYNWRNHVGLRTETPGSVPSATENDISNN